MGKSLEHFSILELVSVHDLPKGPLSKPNSRLQFCRERGSFDKAMSGLEGFNSEIDDGGRTCED